MASLTRLPAPTQSKLRSTQILTSLSQIISELVQNALDAQACQIDIGVDCEEWSCWVRDDGIGMSKDDLTAFQDAGRYGTSKAYNPESLGEVSSFGFRGEALSSAADLCCLEICSRTVYARGTWSIILKGGQSLYNGPAVRWRREQSGTVVCVQDAFHNLPIRRLSHPSPQRTIDSIRKDIETFALLFPHVAFNLENTHRNDTTRSERRRVMAVPRTQSTIAAFRHLFGRALVEHVDEINESKDSITITGFISLEGNTSRTYQYLYINKHILSQCDLHRTIDSVFASSTFGRHALDEYMELSKPLSSVRRSPRKVDKKPVYVLNITIPPREVDNCLEPAKNAVHLQNSNTVSSFLANIVQSFLIKHNFKANPTSHNAEIQPRKKKRKIEHETTPLVKSRKTPSIQSYEPPIIPGTGFSGDEDVNLQWTDPRTGQTFVVDKRTGNSYPINSGINNALDEDRVVDASRGRRTIGRQAAAGRPPAVGLMKPQEATDDAPAWIRNALKANEAYALKGVRIPELVLSSTFANALELDPSCNHGHSRQNRTSTYKFDGPCLNELRSSQFTKSDLRNGVVLGQVDRKFIACVISSRLNPETSRTRGRSDDDDAPNEESLVLIDQHAAHERVRVEMLMETLCCGGLKASQDDNGHQDVESTPGPKRRTLEPPVMILLTKHEAERLSDSSPLQAGFATWGLDFIGLEAMAQRDECTGLFARVVGVDEGGSGYAQVSVKSVPEVVADKLLTEDNLRDLIKSYISEWESLGGAVPSSSQPPSSDSQPFSWFRAIRQCPKNLLELVNSKACRGAIMFNDVLTLQQCQKLVEALCETALPFQCAHGRPSLVPLAGLKGKALCGIAASRRVKDVDWEVFV